ncbi:MAG: DUF4931 domain-containing protein [Megasphaera sp.]|jgi:galactose-1-phosphate uridylyltransferase|nr:DUF4931 domain-containing protein [Megasphaera sp.]MCH4187444.1 DUF4931 domain-containing protein [Megasphaera sp.]MCH4217363.1 DUF4931 domain-containing protein [Megasphaera sp.]
MEQNPLQHILEYNLDLGKTKPDTVHRDETYCPFCDVAHLKHILEKRGRMIWLENAYPVLKDSWQTLIIETNDCNGEFSDYDPEYATKLIQFGLEKWQQVKDMGKFKSVVFYRNHGYMSGGTIHHPHSQIVGFKTYDYHDDIHPYHLLGTPILTEAGIEINLSVRPIIGFYEVNLILSDKTKLDRFVRYMQVTSTYFRHSFVSFNDSYNIFFYDFPNDDKLYVKIVPRFLTNPLYVGYMIAQIANGGHSQRFIDALKKDLQKTK